MDSSNCPSLARVTSATETPAFLANCSSLNCSPRWAFPSTSLKLSSSGILFTKTRLPQSAPKSSRRRPTFTIWPFQPFVQFGDVLNVHVRSVPLDLFADTCMLGQVAQQSELSQLRA